MLISRVSFLFYVSVSFQICEFSYYLFIGIDIYGIENVFIIPNIGTAKQNVGYRSYGHENSFPACPTLHNHMSTMGAWWPAAWVNQWEGYLSCRDGTIKKLELKIAGLERQLLELAQLAYNR